MVKKRNESEEVLAPAPELPPAAPLREPAQEYTVSKWSGMDHYQCNLCPVDSLNQVDMLVHLVDVHGSERALEQLYPKSDAPAVTPTNAEGGSESEIYEIELKEE